MTNDDTLLGVPLFQEAQKCPLCGKVRRCSHRVRSKSACDYCFSEWAKSEVAKLEGYEGDKPWLVKTMHNMILGPFSGNAIQKWLREGLLSYTVEVSASGTSQWTPVTQDPHFERSARDGRRQMHGDFTSMTPAQGSVARKSESAPSPVQFLASKGFVLSFLIALGLVVGVGVTVDWSKLKKVPALSEDDLKRKLEGLTREQQEVEMQKIQLQFLSMLHQQQYLVASSYVDQLERLSDEQNPKVILWRSQIYRLSGSPKLEPHLAILVRESERDDLALPLRERLLNEVALAHLTLKRTRRAQDIWEEIIQANRGTPLTDIAKINFDISKMQESKSESNTQSPPVHIGALVSAAKSGRAVSWRLFFHWIQIQMNEKKWESALLANDQALRLFPFIPEFLAIRASLRRQMHSESSLTGDETLEQLYGIQPDILDWIWNPPELVPRENPYSFLAQEWERFAKSQDSVSSSWFSRALASLNEPFTGLPQELIRSFKDRADLPTGLRGFYCWYSHRFSSSSELTTVCKSVADVRVFIILGKNYIKEQNYQDALNMADKILMMEPQNPWGAWIKAKSYFSLNRVTEADALAQKYLQLFPHFFPLVQLLLDEGFDTREFL